MNDSREVGKPILEQISEFIKTTRIVDSKWLYAPNMQVYVRKGIHFIEGEGRICLDIANITVYQKGKGTFTQFLKDVHTINPWYATYVECVHDSRLRDFLARNNWIPNHESFYKIKS